MKRLVVFTVVLLALAFGSQMVVAASDFQIVLGSDTIRTHKKHGQHPTYHLLTQDTPPHLIGLTCTVTGTQSNEEFPSIHPNSDLLIRSATDTTIPDIERESTTGPITIPASDPITLSDTVQVILVMGPDGKFSAGITLDFTCPPPETTTTTTTTTTVPETTTTTIPETTTTLPETTTTTTIETTQPPIPPTLPPAPSPTPTTPTPQLPATGSETTEIIVGIGIIVMFVGIILWTGSERSRRRRR